MVREGRVHIKAGIFVIKDPENSEKYATIVPPDKGILLVNNIPVKEKITVKESDVITYKAPNQTFNRTINVKVSKDKMKAYISIIYQPKVDISLKDSEEVNNLNVETIEKVIEDDNIFFSAKEIEKYLNDDGIIFGIKNDVLYKIASQYDVSNVLIAEGLDPIDAVDDSIEFLNKEEKEENIEDSLKAVDYRNTNKIYSIVEGEVIANITRGKASVLGKNILGKEVRSKKNKIKVITSGAGCKIDGNKVRAIQDGLVTYRKNVVSIHEVYEVKGNVDISTGNINFQGDVYVEGSVTEGMLICAKNNINVLGSAYGCNVIALGDININGSVINTNVSAGGEDLAKVVRLKSVKNLEEVLEGITKNVEFIIENNLLQKDIKLGEVIRTLIDTKYKNLNKICTEVICNTIKDRDNNSLVIKFINDKLIGLSVLNINAIDDLIDGINLIKEEIGFLEEEKIKAASVEIDYCQESRVQASGDIRIKGKGIFSTEMYSLGSIEFIDNNSVCRGGVLKAKNEIKAPIVGSQSGVRTLLEAEEKEGRIAIDVAYNNTEIIINNKKHIIEKPSRQVNCYIDSYGELIVDKFIL